MKPSFLNQPQIRAMKAVLDNLHWNIRELPET